MLAETVGADLFHPKLIARLSESGGRVWVGSGNLTYTGWGGNQELATSWRIGPNDEDGGAWLNQIFEAVSEVVRSTIWNDQLREIRNEIPWLGRSPSTLGQQPVLLGKPGRPLATQLAERWRGRRFENLKLCTGSTDVSGEFLRWTHRTFGVRRATICLSPVSASFDARMLAKLPLDVRIVPASPDRFMHAKFYWFSGSDGDAAVVGSANCSAAAWLSRNIELVVPYDEAQSVNFQSALSVFNGPSQSPAKALPIRPPQAEPLPTTLPSHWIASLRLRPTQIIEAVIEPQLDQDAKVHLVIEGSSGGVTVPLQAHRSGLTGHLPQDFEVGKMTLFAHAVGVSSGVTFTTEPRWIDNDAILERATRRRPLDPSLEKFSRRSLAGLSHQEILEAVQAVSAQLLDPQYKGQAVTPPSLSSPQERAATETEPSVPLAVDPSAMIRSLNEIRRAAHAPHSAGASAQVGVLGGVIGMLFAEEEQDDVDLTRETWSSAEPQNNLDEPAAPVPSTSFTPVADADPDRNHDRNTFTAFREEMGTFLGKLGDPVFAQRCDASRMVQALAFPLLLCTRGGEAGWLPPAELAVVATRVADIMFNHVYERGRPRGLLATVRERYAHRGQIDGFRRLVGDGTLWTALLAALSIDATADRKTILPQASALASVFQCKDLLANSDATLLSGLIRRIHISNAEGHIAERAERIAQAADELSAALSKSWERLYKNQGNGRRLQPAKELLWSLHRGWYITLARPAESYHPDYIRLDIASDENSEIQEKVTRVIGACN